jgi:hypothetical protein
MAQFEIKWQAPEYQYHEKGVSWYWLSIIIAALVVGFSIWEKNFLFGFFVVIAEMLFIVWGSRTPRMVDFAINDTTLEIDGHKSYSIKEFETMSVDDFENGWAELVFVFRAKLRIPLKVIFPTNQLTEFRAAMKIVVKEVPYEPTVLDSIEKILRF